MSNQRKALTAKYRWPIVCLLLSIHALLASASLCRKSATFDEPVYLTGGVSAWQTGDYRINPENGILPQRWTALPLLFCSLRFPEKNDPMWQRLDQRGLSRKFLYEMGNDFRSMLLRARLMTVTLSVCLGLLVYHCSRRVFGDNAGLLSVFLYALSPTILAHARLITADLFAALGFTASAWTVWIMLQRVTVSRVLLASLALAFLFLAKMSAVFFVPVYLIMAAVRLMSHRPMAASLFKRTFRLKSQSGQLRAIAVAASVNVIIIIICIWAAFGFRYRMMDNDPAAEKLVKHQWTEVMKDTGFVGRTLGFARQHRLLPETYLFGFAFVFKYAKFRYSFLNGMFSTTGWWYYFPYAMLIKTPLPMIGILVLALIALVIKVKTQMRTDQRPVLDAVRKQLYPLTPFVALIMVTSILTFTSKINIGHRHVLFLYPLFFILAGYAVQLLTRERRRLAILLLLFVLWLPVETLMIWPDYLAYFNQLIGGPANGYHHLVDSSLDWGQDLPTLKQWLAKHRKTDEPVYFSYFGTAFVDAYDLPVTILPSYRHQDKNEEPRLRGGIYCISATMFQMIYLPDMIRRETGVPISKVSEPLFQKVRTDVERLCGADATPEKIHQLLHGEGQQARARYRLFRLFNILRFIKLCSYLHQREPDHTVGYSILIFHLSDQEIKDALSEN